MVQAKGTISLLNPNGCGLRADVVALTWAQQRVAATDSHLEDSVIVEEARNPCNLAVRDVLSWPAVGIFRNREEQRFNDLCIELRGAITWEPRDGHVAIKWLREACSVVGDAFEYVTLANVGRALLRSPIPNDVNADCIN
jgi:hypothetical protein